MCVLRGIMHNLVPFNQLLGWSLFESVESKDQNEIVNDYFQCIVECDDDQQTCKRICRDIFSVT
jgi:hypothetical protein